MSVTTAPEQGLLEGRTAIVSGIGPGLGRDNALALARNGARVALLARSEARLAEVAAEVEALGVEDGRITAVGSETELRAWARERGARVVDLAGKALLPGFIDAHGHYPGAGIYAVHVDLNAPPIGDVEDMDGLVAKLAARAGETDADDWIVGWGYDDTLLAEKRHPTRRDLDLASEAHKIDRIVARLDLLSLVARALIR